jgi:hypothetical protein
VLQHKTPQFFLFPIAKGGTKTSARLPFAEGLTFQSLDRRFNDGKMRNDKKRFHPSAQ